MIEVKDLTKKYGDFVAVQDLNFKIEDGEIVGFLGPNGAGKSTTMNMITGYIESTKGDIIVNGYDISKKPKKVKRQIGYMPESTPLYSDLTVKEFIRYMAELKFVKRKDRKQEIERILEQTGLVDVQNKLIKNLSRGYKQRVSLAGALIGNPEVIILDEPTVGLDPKQITEIRSLIKNLGKNHTVILSSHILSEVSQICEKVIIINKGKIIAIDTPENLENKTKGKNTIILTVEDNNNNMKNINEKIEGIQEITLEKDNEDGTKQYKVISDKDIDLRKKLFEVLPKEGITIFELKQGEATLEDAFIKLIEDDKNEQNEDSNKKSKVKNEKNTEKKKRVKKDKQEGGKK